MSTTRDAEGEPKARARPAPPELEGFQRKALRARAHGLSPVAQVGGAGVSDRVVAAIDAALRAHELVKVRMLQPPDKKAMADELARATGAALCGLVGHTAILYRPGPDAPRVVPPSRPGGGGRAT
ncbi:MAG TPA: YhbY family RNA-binding protein [Myxococcota bacterium]|nr:YhbY family RNA-binding protein [Myxococcota bacterium]